MSEPTRGRPPEQTDDEILAILDLIADKGLTLKAACKKLGAAYSTIRARVDGDETLSASYTRARQEFAESQVAKMFRVARTEQDVQRARLICDNIKWYAQRVVPKFYGERQQIEHTGANGGPMQFTGLDDGAVAVIARRAVTLLERAVPTQH